MSKWINTDLFKDFQKEKIEEKDTSSSGIRRSDLLWETPDKGTVEQAKMYEGRFLPDPNGEFYKRYYYHFWQSGEDWIFILCPKTPKSKETASQDYKNFCPFCAANSKLYAMGTKQDKAQAYMIKRKERFVGNWFVSKDPRDSDRDEENKVVGKVRLYEFPSTVEKKLKKEITNTEQGYGMQIFDPSSDGRNLILQVLSTKKDENGRQWPDYSNSEFSRIQSAIAGSDDEIDALMETCTALSEYIDSMSVSMEKQVEILKNEFLWEIVEQECLKHGYKDIDVDPPKKSEEKPEEKPDDDKKQDEDEAPWNTGEKEKTEEKTEEKTQSDDLDDDDLLAELDSL